MAILSNLAAQHNKMFKHTIAMAVEKGAKMREGIRKGMRNMMDAQGPEIDDHLDMFISPKDVKRMDKVMKDGRTRYEHDLEFWEPDVKSESTRGWLRNR